MMLRLEGLFRLDVCPSDDTLRTVVRNLSSALDMHVPAAAGGGYAAPAGVLLGEVAAYLPSRTAQDFELGEGEDRVGVAVTIATLRFPERGTVQVTAQALVRGA
jgi:hypothetical protein